MKNRLLSMVAILAVSAGIATNATTPQRVDFRDYVSGITTRSLTSDYQWRNKPLDLRANTKSKVVTSTDNVVGPASYWGTLNTPSGEEWMYTCEYSYISVGEYGALSIASANITIYDSNFKVYKNFTANFELGEHETSINSVQVSPILTKKFFNINESYDVMVYVHATTEDYTGHAYTQVYTLSDGSLIQTIEGDCIASIDTATDPWSEKFTLVFMRDYTEITEESYNYYLYFDIYSRAGWGTGCKLEHTFDVNYALVAGAGNYALPLLVNKKSNDIYYALPRYEKPYFVSDWSEDITPDNNFIIDLYDSEFNLTKTTKIPMELEEGAYFSFPGVGELFGFDDLSFGVFSDDDAPMYVVGVENYITSTDDFVTSLYVYDSDGNRVSTIIENANDYLRMSDVEGFEKQFCFLFTPEDAEPYFKFIDLPSCTVTSTMNLALEQSSISTSIDRVAEGGGYKYVSSVVNGFIDGNNNVHHRMAWFNADGTFDHYTSINLGDKVTMALPYVASEAFNPYLFDTTDGYEYMFLVKELYDDGSSRAKECLRIFRDDNELLLDLGPNDETDEHLSSIFLFNPTTSHPKFVVAYNGPLGSSIQHYDLPFTKFEKGEGTKDNPYLISSAGEMHLLQQAPSAYYEIVADIDMHNTLWEGNKCDFTGVLDGKGHTISNLNLKGNGIVSSLSNGGKIMNLNIQNVNMAASEASGIVAAHINGADNKGSAVNNVHIHGVKVEGPYEALFGGIAAEINIFSSINDCSVTDATIELGAMSTVGGIIGEMQTGTSAINCLFDGWIHANVAGGIAGETERGDETIKNCHVHADIKARSIAGGIIGYSSRTTVNNCYVDGNIEAYGAKNAHSGGIVGELRANYDDFNGMVVENCVTSAVVTANSESESCVTHRIVGFTSGDEMLVDWESKDPNVDWTDPSTYPYVPGAKENAIGRNYFLKLDGMQTDVDDDEYGTEGKCITKDELDEALLAGINFVIGNSAAEPWKFGGNALVLYYETFGLKAIPEEAVVAPDLEEAATIGFTCDSRYAHLIEVEVSDKSIVEITEMHISADGRTLVCTLGYLNNGSCTVTAKLGEEKAVCVITSKASSIIDVDTESSTITYDGTCVAEAEADIRIYNIAGILVAEGHESVNVTSLSKGIYIAVSDNSTLKFSR